MRSKLKLKLLFFAIFILIVDLQPAFSLQVPSFLTSTPAGHFAGVSAPCPSLSEARKSAILDVVRQVLGSICSLYGFESKNYVKGNVRGAGPWRAIDESLSGTASGIMLDVERKSHVGFMLKRPYCFWASRPSKKLRLDESFHMRYTMLQNTLLVTMLKHLFVSAVFSSVPLN